jgi:hypothetical protein
VNSGGLRIEDGQSDGGIDTGFNSGFHNGFFGDFDNGFFGGSDEGFDSTRRFDGIRLETFRLGFSRGIDRALFNDEMGRHHSHFKFLIQACHNSLQPLCEFSSASSNSSTRLSFHAMASMRSSCYSATRLRSLTLGSAVRQGGVLAERTGQVDLETARRIIILTGTGESQGTHTKRVSEKTR